MAAPDAVGQLSGRNPLDSMAALINFVPVLMAWQHASHSVYTPPLADYRGFAYVTVWPDGSRSDVAFLRGPDAHRLLQETSAYVRSLLQVPPAQSQVALAKMAAESTVVTPAHTYPLSPLPSLPTQPPQPSSEVTTENANANATPGPEEPVTAPPVPDDDEAVTASNGDAASSSPREDAFTPSEGSTEDPTSSTDAPATEATEATETTTTV